MTAAEIEAMIVAKQLSIMAQWHEKLEIGKCTTWEAKQNSGLKHPVTIVREVSREEFLAWMEAIGGSEENICCQFFYEVIAD